jgi:dipeptidyl aminopeptidase/acylaminoacyl peptidase
MSRTFILAASRRRRALRSLSAGLLAVLVASTGLLLDPGHPARATFPGVNGRIAFHTSRDGNYEIYSMNADGTSPVNLTNHPAADTNAAWSPDGTRIAFVSERDGNPEVYVMDADGTDPLRLTSNASLDAFPVWSPDGLRLAFVSSRDGDDEVYTIEPDGTALTQLTVNSAEDSFPTWSPDGSRIAFDSDRDGRRQIYVMHTDGSVQENVSASDSDDTDPAWSPDGTRIAFNRMPPGDQSASRPPTSDVYVMNADGSDQQAITDNSMDDSDPAWSPDGSKMAFERGGDLYVMNANGTGAANITSTPYQESRADWQPLVDTDRDGCFDPDELFLDADEGGQRDPDLFWDFFDVPTAPGFVRDRLISISDIVAVASRYGSSGSTSIDPLSSPPPAPAYHAAYDRTYAGPNPWNSAAPDGAISVADISRVVAQFGHSCA